MYSEARRRIRVACEEGTVWMDGAHISEVWGWYIDTDTYREPSAVADLVRTGRNGGAFVGAAFRASVRRDIPGRYPRLDIP
jgi:hypothetical protein